MPAFTSACAAPTLLYRGPMFDSTIDGVPKHSAWTPAPMTVKPFDL